MTGYQHSSYVQSLSEYGVPLFLPQCNAWLLKRSIFTTSFWDTIGCYPLFSCQDWSKLDADINELTGKFVSVALVADPFGEYAIADLKHSFPDRCIPFKEHYFIDLHQLPSNFVASHHQRNAKKALSQIQVERCESPTLWLADWEQLYHSLTKRHNIKGISAFSANSFASQLNVPGLVMFRAVYQGVTVGMLLWYVQNGIGYYHLGAYSDQGYKLRSSFALFWEAISYFAESGLQKLNLGGGAGISLKSEDGLSRFKRGWATGTRLAYFCGRILDCERYLELIRRNGGQPTSYFPAYRSGEFQ